jgi:hypothetical protein
MATDRLIERTLAAVRDLRQRAVQFEAEHAGELDAIEPHFRSSARRAARVRSMRRSVAIRAV